MGSRRARDARRRARDGERARRSRPHAIPGDGRSPRRLQGGDDLEIRLVSDDGSFDPIVHRQEGEELASVWRSITRCEPPPPPAQLRPEKIHHVDPVYSSAALANRVQGVVVVEAVIDREGSVRDAVVVKGLGYGLDEAAIEAVSRWRFKPAMEDGQPVASDITLTLNFRLPRSR